MAQYAVLIYERVAPEDLPAEVRHEGVRSFVNWLGCAIGGAPHPGVAAAARAATVFGGAPGATLLGMRQRADPMAAAIMAKIAAQATKTMPQQTSSGMKMARAALTGVVSCISASPKISQINAQMLAMAPPQNGTIPIGSALPCA